MQKRNNDKSYRAKHGVTLVELCIVMALISIITVMVSSFCIITRSYTIKIAADTDIKLSIGNIDDGLRIWMSSVDSERYRIYISEDSGTLTAESIDGSEIWKLYLENNTLIGSMPSGARINFEMPTVSSLSFRFWGNAVNERPCFVWCTVYYDKPGSGDATLSQSITVKRAARVVKRKAGG